MTDASEKLIRYFKGLGLVVKTKTKARGHLGIYMKNRIDISKNLPQTRIIPTLMHEFAHHIHSKIEPDMIKTGGSLEVLFDTEDIELFKTELLKVTNFVDFHSKCEKLRAYKKSAALKISEYENIIKEKYPKFMRSKKFKEFDKYIKHSKARYLLKADRVRIMGGIFTDKTEEFSIDNIEKDFPDMPKEFAAYIRLKSCQKRQTRVSSRINRLTKYYCAPTELFARFVEGLYIDNIEVQRLAPNTCYRFFKLLHNDYYPYLYEAFDVIYDAADDMQTK